MPLAAAMHAAITPEPVPPEVPPPPAPPEIPPVRDPPQHMPPAPVHDPPAQPPVPMHAPPAVNETTPPTRHADCPKPPHPSSLDMPTTMSTGKMNAPLPPLPYGAADHVSPQAQRTLSEAILAVSEHCRQLERRRMALALREREEGASQGPRGH